MADEGGFKISVDDDWKSQARAEKERLAQKLDEKKPAPGAPAPGSSGARSAGAAGSSSASGSGARTAGTPADWSTLVSTMAAQSLLAMGAIPDPQTGQRLMSLDVARHHIDMLGILETKTKGNLTADEETTLASTLYELRSRYIRAAQNARAK